MMSIKLNKLEIINFKTIRNHSVLSNIGAFNVILVPDFYERSTIFQAIEFVFGGNSDGVICDVVASLKRNSGTEESETFIFRRKQIIEGGQKSGNYMIAINGESDLQETSMNEYFKQLKNLKINVTSRPFLISGPVTDLLGTRSINLTPILERYCELGGIGNEYDILSAKYRSISQDLGLAKRLRDDAKHNQMQFEDGCSYVKRCKELVDDQHNFELYRLFYNYTLLDLLNKCKTVSTVDVNEVSIRNDFRKLERSRKDLTALNLQINECFNQNTADKIAFTNYGLLSVPPTQITEMVEKTHERDQQNVNFVKTTNFNKNCSDLQEYFQLKIDWDAKHFASAAERMKRARQNEINEINFANDALNSLKLTSFDVEYAENLSSRIETAEMTLILEMEIKKLMQDKLDKLIAKKIEILKGIDRLCVSAEKLHISFDEGMESTDDFNVRAKSGIKSNQLFMGSINKAEALRDKLIKENYKGIMLITAMPLKESTTMAPQAKKARRETNNRVTALSKIIEVKSNDIGANIEEVFELETVLELGQYVHTETVSLTDIDVEIEKKKLHIERMKNLLGTLTVEDDSLASNNNNRVSDAVVMEGIETLDALDTSNNEFNAFCAKHNLTSIQQLQKNLYWLIPRNAEVKLRELDECTRQNTDQVTSASKSIEWFKQMKVEQKTFEAAIQQTKAFKIDLIMKLRPAIEAIYESDYYRLENTINKINNSMLECRRMLKKQQIDRSIDDLKLDDKELPDGTPSAALFYNAIPANKKDATMPTTIDVIKNHLEQLQEDIFKRAEDLNPPDNGFRNTLTRMNDYETEVERIKHKMINTKRTEQKDWDKRRNILRSFNDRIEMTMTERFKQLCGNPNAQMILLENDQNFKIICDYITMHSLSEIDRQSTSDRHTAGLAMIIAINAALDSPILVLDAFDDLLNEAHAKNLIDHLLREKCQVIILLKNPKLFDETVVDSARIMWQDEISHEERIVDVTADLKQATAEAENSSVMSMFSLQASGQSSHLSSSSSLLINR